MPPQPWREIDAHGISVVESDCVSRSVSASESCSRAAFSLLLKHTQNVPLGPKSRLQMPVTFTPHDMKSYQARCTVSVRREDGLAWDYAQQNGYIRPLATLI